MTDKLFRAGIRLKNEVGATTLRYHHFLVSEITIKKEVKHDRLEQRHEC